MMTKDQQKRRVQHLWNKARSFSNKLRLQARLQKMADQNLREMMIEDIQDQDDDDSQTIDNQQKIKWYLIDTERTFCKVWNQIITFVTIYNLCMTPFILVFPEIYTKCKDLGEDDLPIGLNANMIKNDREKLCPSGTYGPNDKSQNTLKNIELTIDIIYTIEILFCFVKRTMSKRDITSIATSYLKTYFVFDIIATLPNLLFFE
jgi:hypothetical protein